jgi:hypothetical protein
VVTSSDGRPAFRAGLAAAAILLVGAPFAAGADPNAPSGPIAGGDAPVPIDSLRTFHESGDGAAFLDLLDRALYSDLVADLPPDRRPARPPLDLQRLVRSLDPTTGLVGLHPVGDEVFAFTLTVRRASTAILDSPGIPVMARRLARWMRDPVAHPYDPHAGLVLYAGLLRPLEGKLAGIRRLVVAASGPLAGLPFEPLLMAPADGPDEISPSFLARRYELSYEPTLGSWLAWSAAGPEAGARVGSDCSEPGSSGRPGGDGSSGELLAVPAPPGRRSAELALRLCGAGGRGALVGPFPGDDPGALLDSLRAERSRGAEADARTVARLKRRVRRADPAAPPSAWVFPLLFGARGTGRPVPEDAASTRPGAR